MCVNCAQHNLQLFAGLKEVKLHVRYIAITGLFATDTHLSSHARVALATAIKVRRTFLEANEEIKSERSADFLPEYPCVIVVMPKI